MALGGLMAEGRIINWHWDRYNTRQEVYRPLNMTTAELEAGYECAYQDLQPLAQHCPRRASAAHAVPIRSPSGLRWRLEEIGATMGRGHPGAPGQLDVAAARKHAVGVRPPGNHLITRRALVCCAVLAVLLAAAVAIVAATLPNVDDAPARVGAVLSAHGGVPAPLPAKVGEAVVVVEDHRFFSHHGIDVLSLVRAAWTQLAGHGDGGGATITAQLAENLYVPERTDPLDALEVARYTLALERWYSKNDILTMYLNAIYFGHGQWGVAQASQTYFHRPPSQLDWAQASLLAGLPQARQPTTRSSTPTAPARGRRWCSKHWFGMGTSHPRRQARRRKNSCLPEV